MGGLKKRPAFFVGFLRRRMRQTPLEKRLSEYAQPVVEDLGFALVCVRITNENGSQTVQVMAEDEKTQRLGVDDAAKISRALSAVFDVEDPIKGAYRLEVSSPGIDRPLTRLEDFSTYEGFEAKLESEIPAENGQRKFRGRLNGLEGENIKITTDQGEAEIPFNALVKAKLVLTDELIKKTAANL
jgi:ribosome maturation factor RimP